jgi:hypothetical protein
LLTHTERLLHFGSELVFALCEAYNTEVVQREQRARLGRLELARQCLRGAEVAVRGQALKHLVIFNDVESLAVLGE